MTTSVPGNEISFSQFQNTIREMYHSRDVNRGIEGTFMWLSEEIGELATALRQGTKQEITEEFADVLAWLTTIANVAEVDLTTALTQKYGNGCPGCRQVPCACDKTETP